MNVQHIINISGGKDSTATYLLAIERGMSFRAVFADTGHEAPPTYEFIDGLADAAGGPPIEIIRADFAESMKQRAEQLPMHWGRDKTSPRGVVSPAQPDERIADVQSKMKPTGNPFLDVCVKKGIFPRPFSKFCTQELKIIPIFEQVILPALEKGNVIQWLGIRRDESHARRNAPRFETTQLYEGKHRVVKYCPLVDASVDDVFAIHKRHGVAPNPLYALGVSRVGCAPCIMASKNEIAILAKHFPETIDRLRDWEKKVSEVSRTKQRQFFLTNKTPQGRYALATTTTGAADNPQFAGIDVVVNWAVDDGQENLIADGEERPCEAGMCE